MLKTRFILAFILLSIVLAPQISVASSTLPEMQKRFRSTNETLLATEERAKSMASERRARVEPVFDILEEELGEIAEQMNMVTAVGSGRATGSRLGSMQKISIHDQNFEVIEGINGDLTSVSYEVQRLSKVLGVSEFY